jgi:uncharacterized repeat protein (TIGR03803 family)
MKRALFSITLTYLPGILFLVLILAEIAQAVPREKVLYRFQGGSDGFEPMGTLVADQAGNLYGATSSGGTGSCQGGCGTVFQLSRNSDGSWTKTQLYSFAGGGDGAFPNAGVTFDRNDNLYGTTLHDGASGDGTVFRLSPPTKQGDPWIETVLYNFVGNRDGEYCLGNLVFDGAGNLYGAALFGGAYQGGTIFQVVPPQQGDLWSLNVLHQFMGVNDGFDPYGPVILDSQGAVYGTASDKVFRLTPPAAGHTDWTFKVLSSLPSFTAVGALLRSGSALYGTTALGGATNNGTIFQVTPQQGQSWKLTTLYEFKGGTDGFYPLNGLVADGAGNLYGVTASGGVNNQGTIFRLSSSNGVWTKTVLHTFQGGSDGAEPSAGMIAGRRVFYGTTLSGGSSNNGTVFQVAP